MALAPGLYVVATPIGNLGDITYRAVETLKGVDLILCEDTRHTAKLCAAYDIRTTRAPYHEHNAESVRPGVLEKLKSGAAIALVSDAGTPLISDPGFRLVREARALGLAVTPIPGPSAAIAALSAAGAPTDHFLFAGFPPAKAGAREAAFQSLRAAKATLVFYEAPQRLTNSLAAMQAVFGEKRQATVARELTKLHEEFRTDTLEGLVAHYAAHPARGEIVILVEPSTDAEIAPDLDALLRAALATSSLKEAVAAVAEASGAPRREVYARALALKAAP
jgi:16S rRNA (cytidine1402-2'-O)-methyltransferase